MSAILVIISWLSFRFLLSLSGIFGLDFSESIENTIFIFSTNLAFAKLMPSDFCTLLPAKLVNLAIKIANSTIYSDRIWSDFLPYICLLLHW